MRPLTRAGRALAAAGLSLMAAGIALGNPELLLLSVVPLLLAAPSLSRPQATPTATRALSAHAARRGDRLEMVLDVEVPPGEALVEIHAPLPPSVELESGTNLLLVEGRARRTLRLRVPARGRQVLPPVVAESLDPLGVAGPDRATVAPAASLDVLPRTIGRARTRGRLRGKGRTGFGEHDDARLGARGSNFRELRDYAWGDPPRSIHWKATARRLSARAGGDGAVPIVSEYEVEARRTVFVLLDGGPALRVGSDLETGLDHGVEAALSLSALFLGWGARVGAAAFHAQAGPPAYPDSGEGRHALLERAFEVGDPDPEATLGRTVERLHGHLTGARPLFLVVTRITPETADALVEGAARLRRALGERRRALPLVVLNVRALALAPAPTEAWTSARDVVEAEDAAAAARVRACGARVVVWKPRDEDVVAKLVGRSRR